MVQRNSNDYGYKNPDPAKGWQPGQSGNPNGRPKSSVTTLLKNRNPEDNKKVADTLYALAIRGDMSAIREYIDRTDGKVTETRLTLGIMAHTTPELLEQAQKRLTGAMNGTRELKEKYNVEGTS
ncbi:hypothetical protein LCGC14_0406200 [marine sediment metagenome]|uniref:DUF5681 domain-containing protein n=1 Tax=marine sediment metagenome TaxID=412755 RepID=A0A0F9VHD2_9ZZZZ